MPGGWRKWSRGNWTAVSDDTEGLRAATEPVDPRLINTQDNGASSFSCAPLLPVISNDHRPTPSMTTEPYRAVPYRTVRTHARSHAQTHNLDRPLARSLARSLAPSLAHSILQLLQHIHHNGPASSSYIGDPFEFL